MQAALPDLEHVRSLVLGRLGEYRAKVFLYGSFARGQGALGSDIDIAVLPLEPIPFTVFSDLREALEDAPILFPVELVDLSQAEPAFRRRVLQEGIVWSESVSA